MIGLIVFCFTLGSIRRTTWPSRWIKPRIGGFSFSSVPRPQAPLSRRRRPARPFFGRPPGCPCARRRRRPRRPRPAVQRRLGDFGDKAFAKMRRHVVDVIVVQAQLLSDLLVRQVQPHEIQTQDPDPKRLMVSSQNSTGQVIEPRSAVLAPVPLPMPLGLIMAMADHRGTGTGGAANSVRPSIVPDQLIALGIIDQGRQIDHLRRSHGRYRLMDDACHRSNQNAIEERHNLLSDMGPMVAPLDSAASTWNRQPPRIRCRRTEWIEVGSWRSGRTGASRPKGCG